MNKEAVVKVSIAEVDGFYDVKIWSSELPSAENLTRASEAYLADSVKNFVIATVRTMRDRAVSATKELNASK